MTDTIFNKIIRREIPADIVYENDEVLAFRDLNPQAPVHVLFIPKKPLATLNDATPADAELLGKLLLAASGLRKAGRFCRTGLPHGDQLQRGRRADRLPPARASARRPSPALAAGLSGRQRSPDTKTPA